MQYVGVNYADGKQFDASWDNGQPFTFQLGSGQVIQGWDQGIAGMKVGGRRELIVPPDLGYGAQGSPPTIEPNETLVFVVDLLDVQGGATSQGAVALSSRAGRGAGRLRRSMPTNAELITDVEARASIETLREVVEALAPLDRARRHRGRARRR